MNLRILKKLSKRAAPLLPLLGDRREIFPNPEGEGEIKCCGMDRKHWLRNRSCHDHAVRNGEVILQPHSGEGWIRMWEPWDPWPGTPMIGEMSGYFEPEWCDETCWDAINSLVREYYMEYLPTEDSWTLLRNLPNPAAIFRTAAEIIAAMQREKC